MLRYESPPRIDWGPDGSRVLVSRRGEVRIRTLDGAVVRELAQRSVRLGTAPRDTGEPGSTVSAGYHDARWLSDGRIVAVDAFGMPVQFSMHGAQYGDPVPPPNPWHRHLAVIAANGAAFIVRENGRLTVYATVPEHPQLWQLENERRWYGVEREIAGTSAVLSADGRRFAMGYRTARGRGWLVVDLIPPKPERRYSRWQAPVVDREVVEVEVDDAQAPLALAFDRTGRRLAIATPDPSPGIGVIRLGAPGAVAREHLGGARCVALDDRGIRAAYAYPEGIGEARLRVDYLSPTGKGPRAVEILDTHWIEPGIGELCALAFEPGGHRIACLGADDRVEVVPVP